MKHGSARGRGFTLIELMVVVAILGIIAAIAIPTFTFFVARSKTSEAASNINNMFKTASSYYNAERSSPGDPTTSVNCTVPGAGPRPATPGSNKQKFITSGDPGFEALNYTIADLVYFAYSIQSAGGTCGWAPATSSLYTFTAEGDLDGDSTKSRFELATGSDQSNTLYHSRGIYILKESE